MNKVWVLVDTILMYRMRYCVETPANNPEYALDDVTMESAKEFSQLYLGEHISSHRVVSEEEALAIYDSDNEYLKDWDKKLKMKAGFTREGERGEN